jgi:hypothetical protein
MDYNGASVSHAKYGRGRITEAGDSYVIVTFDNSPDEKRKFPFPQCFERFLTLEDQNLKSDAESAAALFREQEEQDRQEERRQLLEDTATLQRIIMPGSRARSAKEKPVKEKRVRKASRTPKVRTESSSPAPEKKILSFTDGLETAKSISVSDPYFFAAPADILNHVFRIDCDSYNREYYRFENGAKGTVWFVRLSENDSAGSASSAADTWVCVKNGEDLRMFTRSLSLSSHSSDSLLYVFARTPGNPYRFLGVYERDNERSGPRDVWFRKVSDTLALE